MKKIALFVSIILCVFLLSMGCVCYGAAFASTSTMTVHVYVPEKWSDPHIFSWPETADGTVEWPGIKMTQEDGRWFVAAIPSSDSRFIINDGPGGNGEKTRDLRYLTNRSEFWVIIRGQDDEGHYYADITYYPPDSSDLEEMDPPVREEDVVTVHAFVPYECTDPYVYSWPTGGDGSLPWPGKAMEQEVGRWYSQEIPFYENNVIISSGDATWVGQTQDLRYDSGHSEIWVVIDDGWNAVIYYDEPDIFQLCPPVIEYCYSSTSTSVRVKWTYVEGVDGYELYRSTTPSDPESFVRVKTITDPTVTTYTNQSLTEGVTYYYRVLSYIDEGTNGRERSGLSEVGHVPAAVIFNGPYSNSSFRIRLRWYQVDGAEGYQIWRKEEGGSYKVVKTIFVGDTIAYSNVGLTAGGQYVYKMRAFYLDEDGQRVYGTYSDEVKVGVQPAVPEVRVSSTKTGKVTLTWDWISGADSYQIWMASSPDGDYEIVKSIKDGDIVSYTKSGLDSGRIYYFKMRACSTVDGKRILGAFSETIAVAVK